MSQVIIRGGAQNWFSQLKW